MKIWHFQGISSLSANSPSRSIAYDFGSSSPNLHSFLKNGFFLKRISNVKKHVLSHQHIYAQCFYVEINEVNAYLLDNYECVGFNDVENYPISRLVEIFMNEYLEM